MNTITVELCYVHDDGNVFLQSLTLPTACTIIEGLMASGWLELAEFSQLKAWLARTPHHQSPNHKAWLVGIFAQKKALNTPLRAGDRLEIYRPLALDPIKKRHSKANKIPKTTK